MTTMLRGSALSLDMLKKQDASTSNAVMQALHGNEKFKQLSESEGKLTLQRDQQDDEKLQKGIDFAKDKGVIDPDFVPEPYIDIDVYEKTPEQVAREILGHVDDNKDGGVIVLVGLSGTGKGTTVSQLRQILEKEQGHQVVTWSNGNVFRSVTLLATTYYQQQKQDSDLSSGTSSIELEEMLTKDNLANFMSMLSFDKFTTANGGKSEYDIKINGLGLDHLVSDIANTSLKSPTVSQSIPTVAQYTQGEVISFAAQAVERMRQDGLFVLLEGRAQTVNYVRTKHRFNLTLSDSSLIGQRRAAQRIMAAALSNVSDSASQDDIAKALQDALDKMVEDV